MIFFFFIYPFPSSFVVVVTFSHTSSRPCLVC
uniref:Uncharacterized protein n=1 Tax=Rhizophora mucronata TaxID=61149 RepID=A0A2P2NBN3_RHIMU